MTVLLSPLLPPMASVMHARATDVFRLASVLPRPCCSASQFCEGRRAKVYRPSTTEFHQERWKGWFLLFQRVPTTVSKARAINVPPPSITSMFVRHGFRAVHDLLNCSASCNVHCVGLCRVPLLRRHVLRPFGANSNDHNGRDRKFQAARLPNSCFACARAHVTSEGQIFQFVRLSAKCRGAGAKEDCYLRPSGRPASFFFCHFIKRDVYVPRYLVRFKR